MRLYKLSADKGSDSVQQSLLRLSGQATPPQKRADSVRTIAVTLERRNGVLTVPAILNQAWFGVHFVVDSDASDVVVSETIVVFLLKSGTLSDADFTGSQDYKLAGRLSPEIPDLCVAYTRRSGNRVLEGSLPG